jgi:hypothetical protein
MRKKRNTGRPPKPESERAVTLSISLRPATLARVKRAAEEAERPVSQFVDLTLRTALGTEGAA